MIFSRLCHVLLGVVFLYFKLELLLAVHSSLKRNSGTFHWYKNGHTAEAPWVLFWLTLQESETKAWAEGKSPNAGRRTPESFPIRENYIWQSNNFNNLASYSILLFSSKHRREQSFVPSLLLSYNWKSCLQNFRRDYIHPKIKTKTKIKRLWNHSSLLGGEWNVLSYLFLLEMWREYK